MFMDVARFDRFSIIWRRAPVAEIPRTREKIAMCAFAWCDESAIAD